jgi:hypothetical protein
VTIVSSNIINNNNSTHATLFFFWLLLPRALSGTVGRWMMGHAIVSEEVSDTRAKLHPVDTTYIHTRVGQKTGENLASLRVGVRFV